MSNHMSLNYLLDDEGKPQMKMFGGEIIFSRISTNKIIELASKAKDREGLYKLGKYVYEERMRQIKRENE